LSPSTTISTQTTNQLTSRINWFDQSLRLTDLELEPNDYPDYNLFHQSE
ncbi:hypothetical protein LINPERHAP1_LOCUS12830, partial [Linum perenne]